MDPSDLLERLRQAVDAHDIEAVVACFAPDYRNETPVHPGRGFEGREQVRTNWTRMFAGLPDIKATVTSYAMDSDVVWSEWELSGHRVDGAQQVLRGVIIFGATDAAFAWARFYLEPVDDGEGGVGSAVRSIVEVDEMSTNPDTSGVARDARPPLMLVRLMNPAMRVLLRTPLGRLVRPFALVEFNGRRTGRRYRVPVGWHEIDSGHVVFTPAPWRLNFCYGIPVTVWFRGRRREFTGTLDDDPDAVAAALQALADRRGTLRPIGVDIPHGHRITAADALAVDRALIRFTTPANAILKAGGGATESMTEASHSTPG